MWKRIICAAKTEFRSAIKSIHDGYIVARGVWLLIGKFDEYNVLDPAVPSSSGGPTVCFNAGYWFLFPMRY